MIYGILKSTIILYLWPFLSSLEICLLVFNIWTLTMCTCDNHYILEILTWWCIFWLYCWSLLLCRMETLKRHLPISVPEGLNELRKIAIRFEEKIYAAATSQVYPFALCLCFSFHLIEILLGVLPRTISAAHS